MTIEQANKKMPFVEDEGYVDSLVKEVTEKALREGKGGARRVPLRLVASIAASILLLAGVFTLWHTLSPGNADTLVKAEQRDPLGEFLNNISDEEAQQIEYYEIEEIYF